MSDIRKSLESLADSIEKIEKQNAPNKLDIKDRELSGNKIHGGMITKFSSVGIKDDASKQILTVTDKGIKLRNLDTDRLVGDTEVKGNLSVDGTLTADKLHVNEITSDVKQTKQSPLEFDAKDGFAYGKGILFTGDAATKQLILQSKPDRFWSSEDLDLHRSKSYKIGGQTVIDTEKLGVDIKTSNLNQVGKLKSLSVFGDVTVGDFLTVDTANDRLGLGAENPKGMLSLESLDDEFVIDSDTPSIWKMGTWTSSKLDIVTDDTARIAVAATGEITVKSKTHFEQAVGVKVKNFKSDVDFTVAGAIRFSGVKHEVSESVPQDGAYNKGDIVWNTDPKPTGFVGWVCVKAGSPGDWKGFGIIST